MPPFKGHSPEGTVADQDSPKTLHHIHSPRDLTLGAERRLGLPAPVESLLKSGHKLRPPQGESLNLDGWVSLFSIICVLGQREGHPSISIAIIFSIVILIWSQMLALKMTQNYLAILVHSYPVLPGEQLCQFTYLLLPRSALDGSFATSILLQLQFKWDKGELAVKGKPSQTWQDTKFQKYQLFDTCHTFPHGNTIIRGG